MARAAQHWSLPHLELRHPRDPALVVALAFLAFALVLFVLFAEELLETGML